MARTPRADPDREGVAVMVRLERITGIAGIVLQERA